MAEPAIEGREHKVRHLGLFETHLPVTDLERSLEFYVGFLHFDLSFRDGDRGALLRYAAAGRPCMLGLFVVDEIEHRHPAEYHVAFLVDLGEIDQLIGALRRGGILAQHPPTAPHQGPMTEPIVHGWMPAAAVFFRDPDGHLLEFLAELDEPRRPDFAYRPLSEWRALATAEER